MPAKDAVHDLVRRLLEEAGWTITHDPLYLKFGERGTFVDLGAEKVLGAERQGRKIAVEIKSFIGASAIADLEKALGQFVVYKAILSVREPDRETYVALPKDAYEDLLNNREGDAVIKSCALKLILFDDTKEVIVQWIE